MTDEQIAQMKLSRTEFHISHVFNIGLGRPRITQTFCCTQLDPGNQPIITTICYGQIPYFFFSSFVDKNEAIMKILVYPFLWKSNS